MTETPNLDYLNQLCEEDTATKEKLKSVLKLEFEIDTKVFYLNMKNKEFHKASNNVHKLRHKIGFFGMTEAYKLSNDFENNLRNNSSELHLEFEDYLKKIKQFISQKDFL